MEKESSRKRKREMDIDIPRIKYHVTQSSRNFERLLKENSREELYDVVRKKLNLDSTVLLELVQIREGIRYDLEDDDDFEAFKSAAYAYSTLDIHVSYRPVSDAQKTPNASAKKTKSKKRVSIACPEETSTSTTQNLSLSAVTDQTPLTNGVGPDPNTDIAERPQKRRKTNQSSPSAAETRPTKKRKVTKGTAETKIATTEMPVTIEGGKEPPQKKQKTKEKEKKRLIQMEAADTSTVIAGSSEEVTVKPESTKSKSKKVVPEVTNQVVPAEAPLLSKEREKRPLKNSEETHADAPTNAKRTTKTASVVDKPVSISTPGQSASPNLVTAVENPPPDRPNLTYAELKSRRLAATQALASSTSTATTPPKTAVASPVAGQESSISAKPKSMAKIIARSKVEPKDAAESGKSDTFKRKQNADKAAAEKPNGTSYKATEAVKPAKNGAVVKRASTKRDGRKAKSGKDDSSTDEEENEKDLVVSPPLKGHASAPVTRPPPLSAFTGKKSEKNVRQKPCELCHGSWHFRHLCPVIISGIDSISKRLIELRADGAEEILINELELLEKTEKEKVATANKLVGSKLNTSVTKPSQKTSSSSVSSVVRGWPPVVPPKSKFSEVAVESHEEGSESDTTSSDGEGAILESRSTSESPSSSDLECTSPSVDLANVDLEALVRGPSSKTTVADLARLEEEEAKGEAAEASDDVEMDGVLEEEEEEPVSTRPRLSFTALRIRSFSPETSFEDDDDFEGLTNMDLDQTREVPHSSQAAMSKEVETSLPGVSANIQDETESSDFVKKACDVSENKNSDDADVIEAITDSSDVPDRDSSPSSPTNSAVNATTNNTNAAQNVSTGGVSNEGIITEEASHIPPLEIPAFQQGVDIPVVKENEGRDSVFSSPSAAPPMRTPSPDVPRASSPRINPSTPGTVQRMKDRHGNIPVSPSIMQSVVLQPEKAVPELRKRGRPPGRSNSQPRARSVTLPPSGDEGSSPSQGVRRRGRPPLSEAVKAERQALKNALKEAKAAEKQAKREFAGSRTKWKSVVPPTTEENGSVTNQSPSSALRFSSPKEPSSPAVTAPPVTPIPGSQWQTLPPIASSAASSSPPVDELAPSQSITTPFISKTYPHGDLAGIKSLGIVSVNGVDEIDVEEPIRTLETEITTPTTLPLFLPGASQMTQSQSVPQFAGLPSGGVSPDYVAQEPVEDAEREASPSNSDSETDIDAPAIIPRPKTFTKPVFPSLSQLSFDKFRPSLLLPKAVFGRSQVSKKNKEEETEPQADEESDTDDDDDSSDEENHQSHIPKDKRAGTGVVKKKGNVLFHI